MRLLKLLAVATAIFVSGQESTLGSEDKSAIGVNTAGILSTKWIDDLKSAWKEDFARGEKAQEANKLAEAEIAYLKSVKDARALSANNQLLVQSLDKLSAVYSARRDDESAKICKERSAATSKYLLDGVPTKQNSPDAIKPRSGKLASVLNDVAPEERSRTSEWAAWKRMNDEAINERDSVKAEQLFSNASGYAGAHLHPASNVERETTLVDWAEFDVQHNLPASQSILHSADVNASFDLPQSDPLRQRISRLQAELSARHN